MSICRLGAHLLIEVVAAVRRAPRMYPYRAHLYGDIYSSPGITLAQKQLLMLAFLGVYHMPDQLFGHLLAVGFLAVGPDVK